jgi:hypothetical protein
VYVQYMQILLILCKFNFSLQISSNVLRQKHPSKASNKSGRGNMIESYAHKMPCLELILG